jgi:hypothetical protein
MTMDGKTYRARECGHLKFMSQNTIDLGLDSEHCEQCGDYGVRRTWDSVEGSSRSESRGEIKQLEDLRPGDIMFGPIGGLVGLGVGLGQLALREAFRIGRLSIRHVGIVVEASRDLPAGTVRHVATGVHTAPDARGNIPWKDMPDGSYRTYATGVITTPRLVQAMPSGAEEIDMKLDTHWTDRHAYARLPEDYPGQAEDAAAIARLMVAERVSYSFSSYGALALRRWGVRTPRLDAWINRRREYQMVDTRAPLAGGRHGIALPCEAICSVLADQSWSLAGKRVVEGTAPQVVTPGMMAIQLWHRPGVVWGGVGILG